jgi:flagellar biosynthetic protein FlhB
MSDKSDRTQKATPRKRRKAREKGQIARSRELPFAVTFCLFFLLVSFQAPRLLAQLQEPFRYFWGNGFGEPVTATNLSDLVMAMGWLVLLPAGPLLALVFVSSVGSLVAQGGFVLTGEPLKPTPNKLNPANNVKKIFSKNGLVQLAKSLSMVAIIVYLTATVIRDNFDQISLLPSMDLRSILSTWGDLLYSVCVRVGIFLVLLAAGDFLFQRYQQEENLKMSKQEVKEENKDTEGNPEIKGKIRRVQMEMARKRMMAAVQEADVVVTNPTHFAVALKFDMETMAAPEVVAKGADHLALRIRKVATEHKVPIVENRELARTLYRTVEIGDEVPLQLYRAVAQILAYVYKLKKNTYR